MRRTMRGFTLIEIMLAVTIVSILAALALPAYQSYSVRAKVSEGFTLAMPVQLKLAEMWQQDGSFPGTNDAAGLAAPTGFAGKYVGTIEVKEGGIIVVTYSDPALSGGTATFTPVVAGRTLRWDCVSDLPTQFLPNTCR